MTVGDLDRRMSAAEFVEWMAYWQLEPFGSEVEAHRAAFQAMLTYNAHFVKKGQRGKTIEDMMLTRRVPRRMSRDELTRNIKLAFGYGAQRS